MGKHLIIFIMLAGWQVRGATYYIDYGQGNDSRDGRSAAAAWKVHPYMNGFAGAYTHAAGDRFIFKGGVTWNHTCLPLVISIGGTARNHDYYGVDQTWYSGSSWSKPIFDGELAVSNIVNVAKTAPYVTIDNFNLQGMSIDNMGWSGNCTISLWGAGNVTMSNLHVHKWSKGILYDGINLPGSIYEDGYCGGICDYANWTGGTRDNVIVEYSDIGNDDSPDTVNGDMVSCGACLFMPGEVRYSKIHDNPNGILLGGESIHHNEIYNIRNNSFDKEQHDNVAYIQGTYFYSNVLHDNASMSIYLSPSNIGQHYIYNNVVYNNSRGIAIEIEGEWLTAADNQAEVYVYNNTLVGATGVRLVPRTYVVKTLLVKNNHCIGGSVVSWERNPPNKEEVNNLLMSTAVAAAQGYTAANKYAPTSSSDSTIDRGLDLSNLGLFTTDIFGTARPQGAAWDVGAYEYQANKIQTSLFQIQTHASHPLLLNPVKAVSLYRYLQAGRDLTVYDLTGNRIAIKAFCRPGIYIVEKQGRDGVQKITLIE